MFPQSLHAVMKTIFHCTFGASAQGSYLSVRLFLEIVHPDDLLATKAKLGYGHP
jgi:hypothetical protein